MRTPTALRFERCYADYGAALRRLARVYAPTPADLDDLTQDIWLAIWRALPSFRGDCSERTYLYRIAHNRGLTFRSRTASRRLSPLDEHPHLTDPRGAPDADVEAAARAGHLLAAVRSLADPLKLVVALHLEGMSNREIAEVTGLSVGNVAVRLTRARQTLRERLAPIMEEA